MTEQTKAQRLADELYSLLKNDILYGAATIDKASAELRRLDALVGELVEALKTCGYVNDGGLGHQEFDPIKVSAALAKAKEQT